jgi:hypothetical protein
MAGKGRLSFPEARPAVYRQNAIALRRLATEIRYDFRRRSQLLALADGFERLADRGEGSPQEHAAD